MRLGDLKRYLPVCRIYSEMAIGDARNLDYISHGIPAKIFWSLYCNPMNGYGVAKNVYGVEKNPRTSKIYPNLQLLEESGLIKQDADKKYHIVIESLMPHIEDMLKKQNISLDSDRDGVRLIFQSDICRKEIETMFQRFDFPRISYKADLFDEVTSYLSTLFSALRFSQKEKESSFSKMLKRMNTRIQKPDSRPITQDVFIEFLISDCDELIKTKSTFLNEIIQDRRNETNKFLEDMNYSITDESENLTDEKIFAHILFDMLITSLPYSLQDKMSKMNPEFSNKMKACHLAMKYSLRENLS